MKTENTIKGKIFFCFKESAKVDVKSNFTKIRIQSFRTGKGTSTKLYFEGELNFGEYKYVQLELLGLKPLEEDLQMELPMLLTFAPSMPFGLFIPGGGNAP